MVNTYSQIYLQIVFAVQGRENLIQPEWKEELFKYITGIVRNNKQKLLAVNGVSDHIHLLIGFESNIKPSDLVRDIKANSSRFINEKRFVRGKFYWQEGFGAFSYSRSHLDTVIQYIQNQEKHHNEQTFKQEFIGLLNRFEVEYDKKYLFDWID